MQLARKKICVIGGAGHVGLPLAITLANKSHSVTIYDLNRDVLELIERGKMPFMEKGAEGILQRVIRRTLTVSTERRSISESDVVIVAIGTPVDEHLNPRLHEVKAFVKELIPYLREEQTVILRSTFYPGTSEIVYTLLAQHLPGIGLSFCPERIAEGKAMEELCKLPQIVSGFSEKAVKTACELFRCLTEDIIVTTPLEAELAKLFTNSWRYIQFATANQFYMIAQEYGVNFYRIYDAMTYRYPRTEGFPRPGFAAGPCLFKDTIQLLAFTNNSFFLGHSAMLVNEGLPNFLVSQMRKTHPDLRQKSVGILGMAFKAESDDPRESLSYKLRKVLEMYAGEVLCTDEYIVDSRFCSLEDVLNRADILVIGTPHRRYHEIDFTGREVVDVWGITRNYRIGDL
jgi:UDP-N-acetyl-D-mannosaminuronic acid dehydrogenase